MLDHIRPDWEAKLEAVRAAVARRANRRIIMRQVGDRLIPIGVTSGRVHALSPEEAAAAAASAENGSRRTRRRGPGVGDALEQVLGMTGPDLEEVSYSCSGCEVTLPDVYQVDAHGSYAFILAGTRRTAEKRGGREAEERSCRSRIQRSRGRPVNRQAQHQSHHCTNSRPFYTRTPRLLIDLRLQQPLILPLTPSLAQPLWSKSISNGAQVVVCFAKSNSFSFAS